MDYNSTIRRMRKFLPSVRVLRSQFESKNIIIQTEVPLKGVAVKQQGEGKDPSGSVRKWKSTSNFHPDSASSTDAERSRSRSSSLGSLDEITSTSSGNSSASSGGGKSNQSVTPVTENIPKKDQSVSIISLIQPIIPPGTNDKEKEYDMYRTRHSTAQWNPVGYSLL